MITHAWRGVVVLKGEWGGGVKRERMEGKEAWSVRSRSSSSSLSAAAAAAAAAANSRT